MSQPEARPYIGGQAVLEGVMMRSPHSVSVVVRRRSGELCVRERPIVSDRKGLRAWPLVRGVMSLGESLKLGSEALRFSSEMYEKDLDAADAEEAAAKAKAAKPGLLTLLSLPIIALATQGADPQEPATPPAEEAGAGRTALTALSIMFAVGLFVALPQAAAWGASHLGHAEFGLRSWQFQAMTGGFKLLIVVSYLMLIRRVGEIRRVFQYHGAEHKTISTYEAEQPLVLANARGKTTLHPRCGTTFLVMVAFVSIVVFSVMGSLLPHFDVPPAVDQILFFLIKLPFLLPVAAITFEIQRVFARYCTTGPLRMLLWPGFLVQKITTIEPDDDQLEVALASLRATLWREEAPKAAPEVVSERTFPSYAALSADPGYGASA